MLVYWSQEVYIVISLTIRVSNELHEKLRWISYKERRSQQVILVELLEKVLAEVKVPKEKDR